MTLPKLIVPVILCVVALAQMTLARFSTLTPWKGGSLGMVASVDQPDNRYLSVVGYDGSGQAHTIVVPWGRFSYPEPLTARYARRALAFPSETRLRQIANAVLDANLRISMEPDRPPTILTDSPYRPWLAAGVRDGHQVVVVGPVQDERSVTGLQRVEASVLILDFDVETAVAFFRPIGARGTGRPNPLTAPR